MESSRESKHDFQKGNFVLLVLSGFFFTMSGFLVLPMLPAYLGSLGAMEIEIGFIIGLMPLAAVFSCIPVGRYIDKHSRRGIILLGIFLQATAPFLFTICTDTTQFMVVRTLQGIGLAAFSVTAQTIVVDISPRGKLGGMLGLYLMGLLGARAVGPSLSGLMLSDFGYTFTFYTNGVNILYEVEKPSEVIKTEKPLKLS